MWMKIMSKKILLCEFCGWKKIAELDSSEIKELKNDSLSSRKFRCKKCGRAITPRSIKDPQKEVNLKSKELSLQEENKKWIEEALQFQNEFKKESASNE